MISKAIEILAIVALGGLTFYATLAPEPMPTPEPEPFADNAPLSWCLEAPPPCPDGLRPVCVCPDWDMPDTCHWQCQS